MAMPSKLPRRAISWPVSHLALALMIVGAIPVTSVLIVIDLIRGHRRFELTRVYTLGLGLVANEVLVVWLALVASLVTLNGRLISAARWLRINYWLQDRWLAGLIAVGRTTCGFRVEIENPEITEQANAIVMGRHLSHVDAIFPAMVYGLMAGHDLVYMIKQELQWLPTMDLVGNRLPHVWIDRAGGSDSAMRSELIQAAGRVDDTTVACIFPEGTFFTATRLERAIDRLSRTRPDLVATARTLRHVLPPRPAGSLALLEGAPDADVVVLGHVGLERFSSIRDIIRAVPVTEPIRVRLWRHPRSELPTDPDDHAAWLMQRWAELDAWIAGQLDSSDAGPSQAMGTGA
jgi:1-acyl-sn-glycerol-3-phosphate acyltransferase